MPKFVEYYLTILPDGRWRGISYSHPPRELGEYDISLTYPEYQLLKEIRSLENGYKLLDLVKDKINEVLEKNDNKNH